MKITYIHHSAFSVELETCTFLFDYFEGQLPEFNKDKKLYVFSSHSHHDHFNEIIFEIEKNHPDVTYILSDDISSSKSKNTVFVEFNKYIVVDDLRITTLESSDIGVAFLIKAEGKTIYHAGDLNWWHWEGENSDEENKYAENKFKDGIKKIQGLDIDLAFVPLDTRQGDFYHLGFNYFLRNTNSKYVFPMHFWNDFNLCKKFKESEYSKGYRERIFEIEKCNQVFEIEA